MSVVKNSFCRWKSVCLILNIQMLFVVERCLCCLSCSQSASRGVFISSTTGSAYIWRGEPWRLLSEICSFTNAQYYAVIQNSERNTNFWEPWLPLPLPEERVSLQKSGDDVISSHFGSTLWRWRKLCTPCLRRLFWDPAEAAREYFRGLHNAF